MKAVFTTLGILLVTAALVSANRFLPNIRFTLHANAFINTQLKYQTLALLLAMLVLVITLKLSPESKSLLKIGNLEKLPVKEKWLGISGLSSWKTNAWQLAIFISLATATFMFFAVQYTSGFSYFQWGFLPIVLLISATNSFSEEIIYRFAINGNLMAINSKGTILLASAVLFGLPHYLGFPSGLLGVIMAGVLGYVLSKATYETQGMGIAWFIHFLQDVIIFSALFMMNMKS